MGDVIRRQFHVIYQTSDYSSDNTLYITELMAFEAPRIKEMPTFSDGSVINSAVTYPWLGEGSESCNCDHVTPFSTDPDRAVSLFEVECGIIGSTLVVEYS